MKKNFKKSKFVILPALATLVLTGVASVTGTVAWFTASRSVQANANSFIAYDESRGLEITATNVIGVSVSEDGKTVTPLGVLTDGSFDFTNVWTDLPNTVTEGAQPTDFVKAPTDLKSGAKDENKKDVYYAVQWTYTIGLTKKTGTLAKSLDVMFDLSSTFTGNVENSTATGFRIAMVSQNNSFVFSNGTEKKHIVEQSEDKTKGKEADFEAEDYLIHNDSYTYLADDVIHTDSDEYLGTISQADGSVEITCTAWYEGTDSAVVSGKTMSTVGAELKFYSRNAA